MTLLKNVQSILLREVGGRLRMPLPVDLEENAPGTWLLYALDGAGAFVFVGHTSDEELSENDDPTPRDRMNVFVYRFSNELTAAQIGTTIAVDGITAPVGAAGGEAVVHIRRCGHFHATVSVA